MKERKGRAEIAARRAKAAQGLKRAAGGASAILAALLLPGSLSAYAYGPGEPAPGTEAAAEVWQETAAAETWAETEAAAMETSPEQEAASDEALAAEAASVLADNVLDYAELQTAIHNGNPSVEASLKSLNDRVANYEYMLDQASFDRLQQYSEAKEARKEGDTEGAASALAEYKTLKAATDRYQDMIDSMTEYRSMGSIRSVERQMTIAAQSLFIQYSTLRDRRETLLKQVQLRGEELSIMQTKQRAGLASAVDVSAAETQYLAAQSSLLDTEAGMQTVYANLCYAVGRPADGSLVIGALPQPDLTAVRSIDLEQDIRRAIGNNATLINYRHSLSGKTTKGYTYKLRTTEDGEQKLTAKMRSLYSELQQAANEFESAGIAYQRGAAEKRNADLKYSAGLTSRADQISAEQKWLEAEASYRAAATAVTQAYDTYEWAVTGICALD